MPVERPAPTELIDVLEQARDLGFLGPGPVASHLHHALALAGVVESDLPGVAVDLGTGGGVPGLVLAVRWADTRFALVEAMQRRNRFLADAVDRLGLSGRVTVLPERAEVVGRDPAWRGAADLVTARSFAVPAVTAECAAPLLRAGGRLVVSEPPADDPARWPGTGLELLGMSPGEKVHGDYAFQVIRQVVPCSDRYPRRTGVPAKRPLF